jgi:hypothetical protein
MRFELGRHAATCCGRVFEEFSIEQGASRVDLAVVSDILEAFELKSDLDNFGRLHNQIHAYNRVFDKITIVTGTLFSAATLELVPPWWGVSVMSRQSNGSMKLEILRAPRTNAAQQPHSMAMFLWREEAARALEAETGKPIPARSTRSQLHDQLASKLNIAALRAEVVRSLLTRDEVTKPSRSVPNGGLLHPDASYLDFHCLT